MGKSSEDDVGPVMDDGSGVSGLGQGQEGQSNGPVSDGSNEVAGSGDDEILGTTEEPLTSNITRFLNGKCQLF